MLLSSLVGVIENHLVLNDYRVIINGSEVRAYEYDERNYVVKVVTADYKVYFIRQFQLIHATFNGSDMIVESETDIPLIINIMTPADESTIRHIFDSYN